MQLVRFIKYAHFDEQRAFVQQFVSGVRDIMSNTHRQLQSYQVREEPVTRDRGGFYVTLNF